MLAAIVLVAAGTKAVASLVAPIFLVVTLVITASPLRRWLTARRLPTWLSSTIALLAIYVLLAGILGSLVWSLTRLVETIPQYTTALVTLLDRLVALAERFGLGAQKLRDVAASVDLSSFSGIAQSLLSGITSTASLLTLMVIVVIFMAFDGAEMPDRLELIRAARPRVAEAFADFAVRVRKYWFVTTVFGLLVAVIDVIGLLIIGVPLAITWGVLAFVTNYIPNVGFVLGVIPPALVALLDGGIGSMIAVIAVYVVVNVVVQTIIQPRFTGDAVGITATVAFISLIFWSFLLGALGALLAVPATLFVKALLVDHSPQGRWVAALIDSQPNRFVWRLRGLNLSRGRRARPADRR